MQYAQAGRVDVGQGERAWSGKLKNFLWRKLILS
jgi:hypothetical protein